MLIKVSESWGTARCLRVLALCASAMLLSPSASAKDFGTLGATFDIVEPDLVDILKGRAREIVESGEWARLMEEARDRVRETVRRPPPVEGYSHAEVDREFVFDPSIVAPQDYFDNFGRLVVEKGTRANPLEVVSFGPPLVFVDGDSPEEWDYALELLDNTNGVARVVFVDGSPHAFMEATGYRAYFDQHGMLTRHFGLSKTPSILEQEGAVLLVREVGLKRMARVNSMSDTSGLDEERP